jgi:hypothetical protein
MFRFIATVIALLSTLDTHAQDIDYVELNRCMNQATGYVCPNSNGTSFRQAPKFEIKRVMSRGQSKVYCQCIMAHEWDSSMEDLCVGLSRACDFGPL